jgi:hypothetical protein
MMKQDFHDASKRCMQCMGKKRADTVGDTQLSKVVSKLQKHSPKQKSGSANENLHDWVQAWGAVLFMDSQPTAFLSVEHVSRLLRLGTSVTPTTHLSDKESTTVLDTWGLVNAAFTDLKLGLQLVHTAQSVSSLFDSQIRGQAQQAAGIRSVVAASTAPSTPAQGKIVILGPAWVSSSTDAANLGVGVRRDTKKTHWARSVHGQYGSSPPSQAVVESVFPPLLRCPGGKTIGPPKVAANATGDWSYLDDLVLYEWEKETLKHYQGTCREACICL